MERFQEARSIRLRARLRKVEIASALGVSDDCIRRWECGENLPRGRNAARYHELLSTLAGELS